MKKRKNKLLLFCILVILSILSMFYVGYYLIIDNSTIYAEIFYLLLVPFALLIIKKYFID